MTGLPDIGAFQANGPDIGALENATQQYEDALDLSFTLSPASSAMKATFGALALNPTFSPSLGGSNNVDNDVDVTITLSPANALQRNTTGALSPTVNLSHAYGTKHAVTDALSPSVTIAAALAGVKAVAAALSIACDFEDEYARAYNAGLGMSLAFTGAMSALTLIAFNGNVGLAVNISAEPRGGVGYVAALDVDAEFDMLDESGWAEAFAVAAEFEPVIQIRQDASGDISLTVNTSADHSGRLSARNAVALALSIGGDPTPLLRANMNAHHSFALAFDLEDVLAVASLYREALDVDAALSLTESGKLSIRATITAAASLGVAVAAVGNVHLSMSVAASLALTHSTKLSAVAALAAALGIHVANTGGKRFQESFAVAAALAPALAMALLDIGPGIFLGPDGGTPDIFGGSGDAATPGITLPASTGTPGIYRP